MDQTTALPNEPRSELFGSVVKSAKRVALLNMVQVNTLLRPTGLPLGKAACTPLNSLPVGRDLLVLRCKTHHTPKR